MNNSPHGIKYEAHRPVVMGRRGVVSSGHPLASQAGVSILQKGGNAIDAAIAVAAALNVVEPLMSGIGGDGFTMVYQKEQDDIQVINSTGAAPYAATRERYASAGIPMKGILSVSVPGLLHGWSAAHKKYGTLNLSEVLGPAIDLASNGFPVSHVLSRSIRADSLLCTFPTSRAVFTRNGVPLRPGETLCQQNLAHTLEQIALEGEEAFYEGKIARSIIKFSEEQGGLLTLKDLADSRVRWQKAISTGYRGYEVYEAPPNSSGHVLLQELNMIETFDLENLGCNTAECVHVMVEAKKLAFADREAYMADPDFVDVPVMGLLSKSYARERASAIDPERASTKVDAGEPWRYQGGTTKAPLATTRGDLPEEDTTCFCVVDQWGNAVCQLQSIQSAFGSSLIAGDTGILLNNRMTYWHLDPSHIDSLEPGKRVRHTMNPVMVFQPSQIGGSKDLVLLCGTPGADTQVQTNLQVITHVLDFGMTVTEAVEAPRWRHMQNPTESTIPHTCVDQLQMEARFSKEMLNSITKLGHPLKVIDGWAATGSEVMIQCDAQEGTLSGAADPRRDGYVVSW